jgi:hypothetical protein
LQGHVGSTLQTSREETLPYSNAAITHFSCIPAPVLYIYKVERLGFQDVAVQKIARDMIFFIATSKHVATGNVLIY